MWLQERQASREDKGRRKAFKTASLRDDNRRPKYIAPSFSEPGCQPNLARWGMKRLQLKAEKRTNQ
jgi:hypothetical protein